MNAISVIDKKRLNQELSYDEIKFMFEGFLNGEIPDYQMSSLLMAIVLNGMSDKEIIALTDIFVKSGDILDLSSIEGVKVDKHSTGGIGDKTTLIVAPIVAALGVKVCKMSGRGLGYTGGTIDKLESIPGFCVSLEEDEIIKQVNEIGIALTSQTRNLAPLDKKVYALRDVTATVESIPLIASSIMCKKIASGADKILIDIKVGSGALVKTRKDAEHLSELMVKIGDSYKREVRTLITDMDTPLGKAIGNSLEVIEAVSILKGHGIDSYLYQVCVELASHMVSMGLNKPLEVAEKMVVDCIESGKAYEKFEEFVSRQGGSVVGLRVSDKSKVIRSVKSGIVKSIDALKIGMLSAELGSSAQKQGDKIDYAVGVILHKTVGDVVHHGDALCTIYLGESKDYFNPMDAFVIE